MSKSAIVTAPHNTPITERGAQVVASIGRDVSLDELLTQVRLPRSARTVAERIADEGEAIGETNVGRLATREELREDRDDVRASMSKMESEFGGKDSVERFPAYQELERRLADINSRIARVDARTPQRQFFDAPFGPALHDFLNECRRDRKLTFAEIDFGTLKKSPRDFHSAIADASAVVVDIERRTREVESARRPVDEALNELDRRFAMLARPPEFYGLLDHMPTDRETAKIWAHEEKLKLPTKLVHVGGHSVEIDDSVALILWAAKDLVLERAREAVTASYSDRTLVLTTQERKARLAELAQERKAAAVEIERLHRAAESEGVTVMRRLIDLHTTLGIEVRHARHP
jgi:hypothetical protein